MTEDMPSPINIPRWDGQARVTVDGEWQRGQAGLDGLALVELALEWKAAFIEKGWTG